MRFHALSLALILVAPFGCDSASSDAAKKDDSKATPAKEAEKPKKDSGGDADWAPGGNFKRVDRALEDSIQALRLTSLLSLTGGVRP